MSEFETLNDDQRLKILSIAKDLMIAYEKTDTYDEKVFLKYVENVLDIFYDFWRIEKQRSEKENPEFNEFIRDKMQEYGDIEMPKPDDKHAILKRDEERRKSK